MELREVCFLTCQVPYHPRKPYRIWVTRLQTRDKICNLLTFLTQYIDKRALTPSAKVASVGQNRPAKQQKKYPSHGTFKGKIELRKYSREEYNSISIVQHQQLYELQKKAGLKRVRRPMQSAEI